jgi:hypothetical protein
MGTHTRLEIGAIGAGGMACFAHAMVGWNCRQPNCRDLAGRLCFRVTLPADLQFSPRRLASGKPMHRLERVGAVERVRSEHPRGRLK